MFRLILSIAIGWVLGRERKRHDKSGGSRTMALISLASCLMGILNLELMKLANLNELIRLDIARIPAYCLVAIGFLGAGFITKNKGNIDGLTTSATLFACVPINVCIGMGFKIYGIISAILVWFLLELKYWRIQ
ncbi:MAG: MgtC/SapB family protein [Candidatus Thorarchaeota archaeon]|jgi:putative Mg2+ transporter-C (MgtC) family protein